MQRRVLIVEDPDQRWGMSSLLDLEGHDVDGIDGLWGILRARRWRGYTRISQRATDARTVYALCGEWEMLGTIWA
jgi:hypothetical protein